jgi:hypothetical protein
LVKFYIFSYCPQLFLSKFRLLIYSSIFLSAELGVEPSASYTLGVWKPS